MSDGSSSQLTDVADADTGQSGRSYEQPRSRQRVTVPSIDAILEQLIQLNGAVMLGLVSTKQASLIQRNLKTVLDTHLKQDNRDETGPSQEALIDMCRNNPSMLNTIQPFLTDAQLRALMEELAQENGPV
jgi:hypothetical protein